MCGAIRRVGGLHRAAFSAPRRRFAIAQTARRQLGRRLAALNSRRRRAAEEFRYHSAQRSTTRLVADAALRRQLSMSFSARDWYSMMVPSMSGSREPETGSSCHASDGRACRASPGFSAGPQQQFL